MVQFTTFSQTAAATAALVTMIMIVTSSPSSVSAFTATSAPRQVQRQSMSSLFSSTDSNSLAALKVELNYKPGAADTEFAKRYKHLVGAKVKTVGEAFAEFTKEFGYSVNPLYKSMITDLVGTTHLIVICARFQRDPIWSLGMMTALDLLLKNYPEEGVSAKIISALFKSVGLNESEIAAEAQQVLDWAKSSTREEIELALSGEGTSVIAGVAKNVKSDEFWMYSRYFGIGLLKIMETIGIEMDKDEVYPIMEDWMSSKLGRSHLTACADSDLFFRVREKLDMMETMMKEIEIREKKRLAERLEEKAEQALRAAEREAKLQAEIVAEKEGKLLEKVES